MNNGIIKLQISNLMHSVFMTLLTLLTTPKLSLDPFLWNFLTINTGAGVCWFENINTKNSEDTEGEGR